jgi:hypothetical protein
MNAMRRPRSSALAVLAMIVPAMAGAFLLAGCTSNGGTITTPLPVGPSGETPTSGASGGGASGGSAPASGAPTSGAPSGSGSGSARGGAPASVEEAALASLKAGPTVHIDVTSVDASNDTTSFSDDATATGGQQFITINGTGHATILYLNNVGYLKANESALTGYFGVPATQAAPLEDRWLSFSPGDTLGTTSYSGLVDGITLSSVASEIQLSGPDTVSGPEKVNGQSVLAVTSPTPASEQLPSSARMILYVAASGSRPVLEKLSGVGGGVEDQYSFSDWGESLNLTAPSDALPVSSLGSPVLA